MGRSSPSWKKLSGRTRWRRNGVLAHPARLTRTQPNGGREVAKANGTCSYAIAALIRDDDETKIARSLRWLSSTDRASLRRALAALELSIEERALARKVHELLRAPKGNARTLRAVDRWFAHYPSLLMTTKRRSTYKLIAWVDSAAEAYVRQ